VRIKQIEFATRSRRTSKKDILQLQRGFKKGLSLMNAALPVEEAYSISTDEKQNGQRYQDKWQFKGLSRFHFRYQQPLFNNT
jgi:hypothetical protein